MLDVEDDDPFTNQTARKPLSLWHPLLQYTQISPGCWCTGRALPASPGGSTKLVAWSILCGFWRITDEIYELDPYKWLTETPVSNSSTEATHRPSYQC
jgi:hypothetical protein